MLTEIANDTTNQNILNAIEKKIFVTQLCGTKICFGLMGSIQNQPGQLLKKIHTAKYYQIVRPIYTHKYNSTSNITRNAYTSIQCCVYINQATIGKKPDHNTR